MKLPQRKPLPHVVPSWVKGSPIFFLTINCVTRGENSLCNDAVSAPILSAAQHYHFSARWHLRLVLLMPDHLHMLASFPSTESMSGVIRAWKHYLSAKHGIAWQRDYFDHRLRSHESLDEKALYIRNNPVRAGLVKDSALWPYAWSPE